MRFATRQKLPHFFKVTCSVNGCINFSTHPRIKSLFSGNKENCSPFTFLTLRIPNGFIDDVATHICFNVPIANYIIASAEWTIFFGVSMVFTSPLVSIPHKRQITNLASCWCVQDNHFFIFPCSRTRSGTSLSRQRWSGRGIFHK